MLTSGSADEFVHQLGTLDAIAGHTNDVVAQVAAAADAAEAAQAEADAAAGAGAEDLRRDRRPAEGPESKIADYQRSTPR